jgi:hypothetical protein
MVLEVVNSALCSNLRYNANLIYSILYKRDLFEQVCIFNLHKKPEYREPCKKRKTLHLKKHGSARFLLIAFLPSFFAGFAVF